MNITWNNYTFNVNEDDFEDDEINVSVIDHSLGHGFPAFTLKLKSLWNRRGEGFKPGDYYQAVMNKETMKPVNKTISYAAITHEFFLNHSHQFPNIKNIYSSDLNGHPEEAFGMSSDSKRFWEKQMGKGLSQVRREDGRYKLIVNEQ